MQISNKPNTKSSDYFSVIGGKTAQLFGASAQSGAIVANGSLKQIKAAFDYGYNIGLVYSHEPYERLGEVGIPEELFGDHTKQVFGLFGAYAKNNINLGAEWNNLNDSGLLDGNYNNTLYSLYFNYMLSSKYMLILKHDKVSGNIDNDYSLIAFEFKTKDNFLLAPNYRIGNDQNNLGINFKYSF